MDTGLRLLLECVVISILFARLIYGLPLADKLNENEQTNNSYVYELCQSDDCQTAAARIFSGMNNSVDPCDNFYDYVCGNWTITSELPDGEIQRSYISILMHKIDRELKEILEEEIKPQDDELLIKLKKFYQLCMDLEERDNAGIGSLISRINAIGGWPITLGKGAWKDRAWQEVDNYYLTLDGHSVFITIDYIPYYLNTSIFIPYIQPKTLVPLTIGMSKYPSGLDAENPHVRTIIALARILAEDMRGNATHEDIERDANDIYNFQKAVAKALSPQTLTKKEQTMHVLTWKRLKNLKINGGEVTENTSDSPALSENVHAKIDLGSALNNMSENARVTLDDEQKIQIKNLQSFAVLSKLLKETPNRVIVNYIHYNFLIRMMEYGTRLMMTVNYDTFKYNGLEFLKKRPQWKQCLYQIKMEDGLSYYYVKKHFTEENLPLLNDMIENVKNASVGRIERSEWLDNNAKELIKEKLIKVENLLGYPEYLKNLTHVTKSFEDVSIESNYIETVLSQLRFIWKEKLISSQHPFGRRSWHQYKAHHANAFYVRVTNAIILPAGILQDPYFITNLPTALSYGSLGFIIGHELFHGFDTLGKDFDSEGYLRSWLPDEAENALNKRIECFIEQFNKYTVHSPSYPSRIIKLNGKRLQNENIADSVGMKATYDAFRDKLRKESKRPQKLPGFERYTDDQMFFVSYAHIWCDAVLPEYVPRVTEYETHSPARSRIQGVLSNVEQFAEAFQCPAGSPMNPEKKCHLW